jgi:hypothetical protein
MLTSVAHRISHNSLGIISTIKKGHDGRLFIKSDNHVLQAIQPSRLTPLTPSTPYKTGRQIRYETLQSWGLLPFEARDFSKRYTMAQIRSKSNIKRFIKARRLYVSNLRHKGYSNQRIAKRVEAIYQKNTWYTPKGRYDPQKALESYG